MIRNVNKQLITEQDLLLGKDKVNQSRQGKDLLVDPLRLQKILDDVLTVPSIDTSMYSELMLLSIGPGDTAGGVFVWSSVTPKGEHDGANVISNTIEWIDAVQFNAAVGETDPTGFGCFVRTAPTFSAQTYVDALLGTPVPTLKTGAFVDIGLGEDQVPTNGDLGILVTRYNFLTSVRLDEYITNVLPDVTTMSAMRLSPDGFTLYALDSSDGTIYQYGLTEKDKIESGTLAIASLATSNTTTASFTIAPDGSSVIVPSATTNGNIEIYALSVPWDISSALAPTVFNITAVDITPTAVYLSPDGTVAFIFGDSTSKMYQYNLVTAYNLLTATYSGDSLSNAEPSMIGGFLDGGRLAIIKDAFSNHSVYVFDTPYDITTAQKTYQVSDAAINSFGSNSFYSSTENTITLVKYTKQVTKLSLTQVALKQV